MFAVIYRFNVRENMESDFINAWKQLTQLIYEYEGSLGSRLHKQNDRVYIAYAQWPDKETWKISGNKLPDFAEIIRATMRNSCTKIETLYELENTADMLKTGNNMSVKFQRNIFLAVLGFLAVGAIGGGLVLIISPSGELMGMPTSELRNSPFDSFLIPGIILFSVLGLLPLFLIFALLKKPKSEFAERLNLLSDMHWSWTFSIYVAFALIGWIQIEMIILQSVHWLHTFYMFYSIVILILALLPKIRSFYKK